MIKIQLESSPSFSRILRSKTKIFIIDFIWNNFGGFFYMNICDNSRNQLVSGIKLATGYDLLRGFVSSNTPNGEMYMYCNNITKSEPRFDNIAEFTLEFTDL